MRSLQSIAAIIALLVAVAPNAQAQTNDAQAEEIRRALKVWIGQNVQGASAVYRVELDDRITVVPDGALYRVTLPAGRTVASDDGTLHFGAIEIDLTPMDNGWYDARWRLPESYRIEPTYGSGAMISIGGQSGQAVFAPDFQSIMSMDAELSAIEVADDDDQARLTIDRISVVSRTTEVSPGIYDAQSTSRLDNLRFAESNGRNSVELSDVEITAVSDNARMAELAEFQQRANALTMGIESSNDINQINTEIASFAELIESMPTLLAGVRVEVRHGPVSVVDFGDRFTMNEGRLSMTLDGLDEELSRFALTLGSDGVDISDPDIARLLPRETRFRLAVIDLPNSELVQLGIGTLRSMGTTDPAMAMLMASGGFQQALSGAGSTVEIGPIRIASDIASIDLEGELRPNAASPYGVTGEADMVATGLDTLIAEIQKTTGDQQAIQMLTLLQSLGAAAPDANGRSVRTYAFRIDSSGTVLLNGADIMPLIGGMQQ